MEIQAGVEEQKIQILLWKDRESKRKIYWYLIIQLSMWYNTIHSREEINKINIESDVISAMVITMAHI